MSHRVMGGGGLSVDMVSGRPKSMSATEETAKAQARVQEATERAWALMQELEQGSPGFELIIKRYAERLCQLSKEDRECQVYETLLSQYRYELGVAPLLAQNQVRRVSGPELAPYIPDH